MSHQRRRGEPAFVAKRSHVLGIEALDILGYFDGLFGDGGRWAGFAAWFITEFPGKYGRHCLYRVTRVLI